MLIYKYNDCITPKGVFLNMVYLATEHLSSYERTAIMLTDVIGYLALPKPYHICFRFIVFMYHV